MHLRCVSESAVMCIKQPVALHDAEASPFRRFSLHTWACRRTSALSTNYDHVTGVGVASASLGTTRVPRRCRMCTGERQDCADRWQWRRRRPADKRRRDQQFEAGEASAAGQYGAVHGATLSASVSSSCCQRKDSAVLD